MWKQLYELPKGRSRSVPADSWEHSDGRIVRMEADYYDTPARWVLITPLTYEQAMELVDPEAYAAAVQDRLDRERYDPDDHAPIL